MITISKISEFLKSTFGETVKVIQEFIRGVLEKPTHFPNLKIEELALNKGYIAILALKYRTEANQIVSWETYINLASTLLKNIEKELKSVS